jgi:hypothetical protein
MVCGYCNTCLLKLFLSFSFPTCCSPIAACQRGSVLQPPGHSPARWLHPKLRWHHGAAGHHAVTSSSPAPLYSNLSSAGLTSLLATSCFPRCERVISCANTGGGQLALISVHLNTRMAFDRFVIHSPQRQPPIGNEMKLFARPPHADPRIGKCPSYFKSPKFVLVGARPSFAFEIILLAYNLRGVR